MAQLFGGINLPKPKDPVAIPDEDSEGVRRRRALADEQARQRRGRASTILSGGEVGDTQPRARNQFLGAA